MKNSTQLTIVKSVILFLIIFVRPSYCQTYTMGLEKFISWEDFITNYFDEIEQDSENEKQANNKETTLEQLEELHNHPININTAKREDISSIPFLSETQIDSIIAYRNRKHLLRSLGELQFISGLPYETRCRISLFAFAGDTIEKDVSKSTRFYKGKHEMTTRLDIPLYLRAGDKNFTKTELQQHPNRFYLGHKIANTTRYRYNFGKEVAYGITLQKDSGEPFACRNNYPYDYMSCYLYVRPKNKKYTLLIGDYNMNYGEGLLLGNTLFYGPLQLIEQSILRHSQIRPHTSSDEINYYRGFASTWEIRNTWKITPFISFKPLDGTIKNDTIVSLKTDGLHRSLTELDNRHSLKNLIGGGRLEYYNTHYNIGVNAYASFYNKTIFPPLYKYNKHYLRGRSAAGISLDYSWRSKHWQLKGETASDKELHLATSNTLQYIPNSRYSFSLQQRSFSTHFVSPFSNTLQEGSHVQNEHGVLLGMLIQPWDKIVLTSYTNLFYHPRPTFRTNKSSKGAEFYLQSKYNATRHLYFIIRYKMKAKQENVTGHKDIIQYVSTHRSRISANYSSKNTSINISGDFSVATRQTNKNTLGWMISSRGRFIFSRHINLHAFMGLFFTDDYASRLYAYEPQLQYAASFPTFAYHGARLTTIIQWKFCRKGYLALRYGWIRYFNRDHISSGTQQINSSEKNDLSLQAGFRF